MDEEYNRKKKRSFYILSFITIMLLYAVVFVSGNGYKLQTKIKINDFLNRTGEEETVEEFKPIEMNESIMYIYRDIINIYLKAKEDNSYTNNLNYKLYTSDKFISLVITYMNIDEEIQYEYYTYTIDSDTNESVSFEKAYLSLGYKSLKELNKHVKDSISSYVGSLNEATYTNYINDVLEDNIKFFVDSENKLNILVKIYTDEEIYYDMLLKID